MFTIGMMIFILATGILISSPFWIPGLYGFIYWRWLPMKPGDTLVKAAIELLDRQPLAWHTVQYSSNLAHPEGFLISRYSLEYNHVGFIITQTATNR